MNYKDHIVVDKNICGGEAVLKGTRVTLRTLLASLADGDEIATILRDYPSLTEEHVRAAIAFAADSAREDLPVGVMLVRLGNPSRRQLLDKVELAFHSLIGSQIEGCFVVLTDKKIRITRQP